MLSSAKTTRRGYTLVELLVSIGVFAILTIITFVGLYQSKNRGAVKAAADAIQSNVQAMINNAQSGQIVSSLGGPPKGYGLYFRIGAVNYETFADGPDAGGAANHHDDLGAPDVTIQTFPLEQNISLVAINGTKVGGGSFSGTTGLDAVFDVPNGTPHLIVDYGTGTQQDMSNVTVTVKHSILGVCYAISLDAVSGIVSKRSLTSCP